MEVISQNEVIELVKNLLINAEKEISPREKTEQKKYAELIQNQNDKNLLARMLDESSQIRNNKKLSHRMKFLLDQYGIPGFFNRTDKFLMILFSKFGYLFEFVAMPVFKKKLRQDTSAVIINEKTSVFHHHLLQRKKENIGQNVNLLGEVVLGDKEAEARYQHYLEALKNPLINYISVKISGIYAQINPLNYSQNLIDLTERLSMIYRRAIEFSLKDEKGNLQPKFVNLDMEEYKDTRLTMELFIKVLSLPEFKHLRAGIVVQAYLPDASYLQSKLLEFAHNRVRSGGAPLKIRLVKGANLAMESIISSLKGWENPIYGNKVDVDANYLKLLDIALLPENAKVMHVGVASHNLFTIAYAHLLSKRNQVEDCLSFEMLEGMANYLPRVLKSINSQIILYTPVVKDEHFLNAVAYLVRRLDENTGKDNFLSYSFNLQYGSDAWNFLKKQFEDAFGKKEKVHTLPNRKQDRNQITEISETLYMFKNEPDTNFDLVQNRSWAEAIHQKWMKKSSDQPYIIPVQTGEEQILSEKKLSYFDHSQDDKICICEVHLSGLTQVKKMISIAENDSSGWSKLSHEKIKDILNKTAINLINKRGDLIGCMSAITGKTFFEGDVEVSEAIDFCRYYPLSLEKFYELHTLKLSPKGLILVIPPWNFPTAIPIGGVAAALAGGNRVILKPATVAFPVAWEFAQCFWDAGVPREALQLVCADGREPVDFLAKHPSVQHIIFTGGTDTALQLMKNNPKCPVSAETGGKNAIILTSSCDRDHAIQNILTSAFSNAGQKCSACSLLILEKEIYKDENFKEKLKDAVLSLHAGQVWDHGNVIGPMISNKNDKLEKAFKLDDGESWLVPPVFADKLKYVLKPTVKWGVRPGSYTFNTELFAPLLAVVCVESLTEAIRVANSTAYGLTSGLQSLDEKEQTLWKNSIQAGNLYINRGITGAIVNRQPFGGMKKSALGAGIKAGGPNYAISFMQIKDEVPNSVENFSEFINSLINRDLIQPDDAIRMQLAFESYTFAWSNEFSQEKDINHIHGEQNILRYLPIEKMALRICVNDSLTDILLIVNAANVTGSGLEVSCSDEFAYPEVLKSVFGKTGIIFEKESDFLNRMLNFERVRTCTSEISMQMYEKAAEAGIYLSTSRPLTEGRVELLNYIREQSISYEYHRYGNIIED
jgi:RHH-type proline utilization regulon transcriptional repressor/proline dehydrogenase/delta 1-pyrroline-5-carboxylate dehydrogenase